MKNIANHPLPSTVKQPQYDRSALRSRIVHIGFGAFHRAHQALLTDRVLNQQGGDWGICEVSATVNEKLITSLRQQDHLFTVLEKGAEGHQAMVIGAVHESSHNQMDGANAVLNKLLEPQVAIVSMTITEKGYCIEPGSKKLDLNHPAIRADLATPTQPTSVPGILVEALRLRRQGGLPAFTILSCDNISENGIGIKNAVLGLAKARDAELADWIAKHASFPSTMVDRIVPAATTESLQEVADLLGVEDPCAISCEPFIQWVIEDNFVAGRPDWQVAGVQLVDDVLPFEEMKLRMLNGSHSFLAYLGYLAGYQTISQCMEDDHFHRAAYQVMMAEQAPTLNVTGVDLAAYATQLVERYCNPALKHRTWQIAMDGTQKLPQRLLDSVRWHRKHGSDCRYLILGVAGWMRYVSAVDDAGNAIDVRDPMLSVIQEAVNATKDDASRVYALLNIGSVFDNSLRQDQQFIADVTQAYIDLRDLGSKESVKRLSNK